MKDLLEYLVKNLSSKPDLVHIVENREEGIVDLSLTVDPQDAGLIIGKGGQTIRAIRKLLIAKALSDNIKVNLTLVDTRT